MEIIYTDKARKHFALWKKSGNKVIQKKIAQLIEDISKNPFSGIGKPEALKHEYQGRWSRRIDEKHRLIYEVIEKENTIYIYRLMGHYED
jgi:toxin YoeB